MIDGFVVESKMKMSLNDEKGNFSFGNEWNKMRNIENQIKDQTTENYYFFFYEDANRLKADRAIRIWISMQQTGVCVCWANVWVNKWVSVTIPFFVTIL